MKVILTENVKSLGNVGDSVNVSPGHGRNFLIPGKLAVLADDASQKNVDNHMKRLAKKIEDQKVAATTLKSKLDGITLALIKKIGGNGRLFGTVTNVEVSKELAKNGIEVEKRQIIIDTPIKTLGEFEIKAKLFKGVEANFKVKVEIDPAQAEELKKMQASAAAAKKAKQEADAAAKAEAEAEVASEDSSTEE
jgi:large subunit ribosomal protein L9